MYFTVVELMKTIQSRFFSDENQQFFIDLKTLVEDTYRHNGDTPVVFISHSMGGLMALRFLRCQAQEWKDKYVRAFISLAGCWGGTMKSLKTFAVGDNLGYIALDAATLKRQQITCPSLAWMLPSPDFWKPDEVLVDTGTHQYTVKNYKEIFE